MATSSTVAGYLQPSVEPLSDLELHKVLQQACSNITGIQGGLVRPRWQPEPPTQPSFDTNWIALGLVRSDPDLMTHLEVAGEATESSRDEVLEVLYSFYGPDAQKIAKRFRAGLLDVPQNRDVLMAAGITVRDATGFTNLPSLLKQTWVPRVDLTVFYTMRAVHVYPIATIQSAQLGLDNEVYVTPLEVQAPPTDV